MNKKVVICGVDTSTLPRLTSVEANELMKKIKNGDNEARNRFIMCNLRLVLSIVSRYSERFQNADDLFQIGCIGLIKSIDNFNITLGVRFSTYAVPMIIGEIRRFLRESNTMRVSRGIRDVAYAALTEREKLERESNCEVTVDQIAKEMSLPVFRVVYCLSAISDPISLSETVYSNENDELTLADQIYDKKCSEGMWADNITLFEALKKLSGREKDIVLKRYYEGKTQIEVSDEVGISQAQVSRLEKNAMSHLRENMC